MVEVVKEQQAASVNQGHWRRADFERVVLSGGRQAHLDLHMVCVACVCVVRVCVMIDGVWWWLVIEEVAIEKWVTEKLIKVSQNLLRKLRRA